MTSNEMTRCYFPEFRIILADFFSDWAPGVEITSNRWMRWAGNIALEDDPIPLFLYFWVRHRYRRHESFGVRV
jgi:hypothetical protein